MRFDKLDLNLLVALDALLQEGSVSRAADRLQLTQSATSSALGRLRDYFGDELLRMKGRSMALTPRGEELVDPVHDVLGQIRSRIAVSEPFDPATSKRRISLLASDYTIEVLLQRAMLQFAKEAPGLSFEISPMVDDLVEELQRGRADILITIDNALSTEHPAQQLWEDDFVVVGWSGNRALDETITRETYETLGHVTVSFGWQRVPSFEEWALRSLSIQRRIEIIAPTFGSVANFLVESERIATMHRRLARKLAQRMPLKLFETPFPIPGIRQAAQWATSSAKDPAIGWVVSRLKQIVDVTDF